MKKNILITGGTDGIGKLAAIKLAKKGHAIHLHGRNEQKLTKTIEEVKSLSGNEEIKGFTADFSDLASVKRMSEQLINELPKLNVLINNAGIFKSPISKNKDGLDIRFVVNYFAPYLLTNGLLPLLQKEAGSRVINLSSAAQSPISYPAFSGDAAANDREAYAQSKLAITMWSFYFASQYKDINTIAVNPGSLLNTKMVQEAFGQHWSPANKGADILCDLAVSDSHNDDSGKYFDNDKGRFGEAHPDAYQQEKIIHLIEQTEKLLN